MDTTRVHNRYVLYVQPQSGNDLSNTGTWLVYNHVYESGKGRIGWAKAK